MSKMTEQTTADIEKYLNLYILINGVWGLFNKERAKEQNYRYGTDINWMEI